MTEGEVLSTLRVRVGAEDVHYGGGLVAGAYAMKLFGDLATEATIRLDGHEGLLRAYEDVEFLAPVAAGATSRRARRSSAAAPPRAPASSPCTR